VLAPPQQIDGQRTRKGVDAGQQHAGGRGRQGARLGVDGQGVEDALVGVRVDEHVRESTARVEGDRFGPIGGQREWRAGGREHARALVDREARDRVEAAVHRIGERALGNGNGISIAISAGASPVAVTPMDEKIMRIDT
jgi:hypothetical protein